MFSVVTRSRKGELAMNCSIWNLRIGFLMMIAVFSIGAVRNSAQEIPSSKGSTSDSSNEKAHMDHMAKHGGTFFMCLDNNHHLEGVLLPPGTFRVYLYDDHTKPLKAEQVKLATGTIQIGESDDAPKIALAPGKKKESMEAGLGGDVKFPVAITMLLHLPGMAPDEKPELFSFTFTRFTDQHGPGSSAPMGRMPGMK
jgi:hypothetical protein